MSSTTEHSFDWAAAEDSLAEQLHPVSSGPLVDASIDPPATVLVAGGTGYVGSRLIPKLLEEGHRVRVAARGVRSINKHRWAADVEFFQGDLTDPSVCGRALSGADHAFYLVHSLGEGREFAAKEAAVAEAFSLAAAAEGVKRIIYLGGMSTASEPPNGQKLSPHMSSRHHVGEILRSGETPVTELRAAVIIGSGSLAFEMVRDLVDVLPVMTTPKWTSTLCQPIAIRDVVHYLSHVRADSSGADYVFDIGGPDILSYLSMMAIYAEEAGLRKRFVLRVPVLSPGLSARWVGLVTPLPKSTARDLIESLRHEVVVQKPIDSYASHKPIPYRDAVARAIRASKTEARARWYQSTAAADAQPGDPVWSGGKEFLDRRSLTTQADVDSLYQAVQRIGGDRGYYASNWAWKIRGAVDRLFRGPGMRRGRPEGAVSVGDRIDFWKVVEAAPSKAFALEAEMKLPGRAWLSWEIRQSATEEDLSYIVQVAHFTPRGLLGRVYWYAVAPFHKFIFGNMLASICRWAEDNPVDNFSLTEGAEDSTALQSTEGSSSSYGEDASAVGLWRTVSRDELEPEI